ncbi:1-pyrroline-5-carboxylate dehydrogenase [Savitreella phatthalungensis]
MSSSTFQVPAVRNEPLMHYARGSSERQALEAAVDTLKKNAPVSLTIQLADLQIEGDVQAQHMPHEHARALCTFGAITESHVTRAIDAALAARESWANLHWSDRAAIFLRAADLISGKYRFEIMAATMLGQGKNVWQAEIDAAAELADFLRFNVKYAEQLYATQPSENSPGCWNRSEYRPLEGFVYCVTPFNFTAIAGNLAAVPVLMGNVAILKPSPSAVYSNYLVWKVLLEAGIPRDVIGFVPGDAVMVTKVCVSRPEFAALHYTGSTAIFRQLWKQVADKLADGIYAGYPKLVGETGGKNFHLVTKTADVQNAVTQSVRSAFEYCGQKCSALSRLYVSRSCWEGVDGFGSKLIRQTEALKVGSIEDFAVFCGPVIHRDAFDRLKAAIDDAKADPELKILVGGKCDDSTGFFVTPTVIETTNPRHDYMSREFFGPVLTVYVYEEDKLDEVIKMIDSTTEYALTGAIFSEDRLECASLSRKLVGAAGNFYINEKCTGAVVGQQPFGGARASGTNDKAGSAAILARFVSPRSIKDNFVYLGDSALYPSNH